jgi:hypothetical protein
MRYPLAKARSPFSMRRKSQATLPNKPLQISRRRGIGVESLRLPGGAQTAEQQSFSRSTTADGGEPLLPDETVHGRRVYRIPVLSGQALPVPARESSL